MFTHGRFNARRMTVFITQFLLKNLIFSISQLSFAFFSAYSGQSFFEPGYVSIFNTFASQLVVCAYAVYDTDLDPKLTNKTTKLLLPYLYAETRDVTSFNIKEFVIWYFYGLAVGTMNFFVSYYSFIHQSIQSGKTFGLWQISFTPYIAVVIIHLTYVGLMVGSWNNGFVLIYIIHILIFYPIWVFAYNEWPQSYIYKIQFDFYSHLHFWTISFVISMFAILPVIFVKQGKSIFFPKLIDLIRGNKIGKEFDIKEKLKIDIVKLEKELDSDNEDEDGSVRMSQGVANNVKTSNPGTSENLGKPGTTGRSEFMSLNYELDEGKFNYPSEISSYGKDSVINNSEQAEKSS